MKLFFWAPKIHTLIHEKENILKLTLKIFAYLDKCKHFHLDFKSEAYLISDKHSQFLSF